MEVPRPPPVRSVPASALLNLPSDCLQNVIAPVPHVSFADLTLRKLVCHAFAKCSRRALASQALHRTLPLRTLLSHFAPARVVCSRLTAPEGAIEAHREDGDGRLPLHIALEDTSVDEDVILALLSAHGEAARHWTRARQTPLHLAAQYRPSSVSVISMLVALFPQAAAERGRGLRLPLHVACAQGAPATVVAELLRVHRAAARARTADAKEGFALHLAVAHNAPADAVLALLAAHPAAATVQCGQIGLPLHGAALLGLRASEAPAQLMTAGGTAASFSAAAVPTASVRNAAAVLLALLEAHPQTASQPRRHDGRLAIHVLASAIGALAEACHAAKCEVSGRAAPPMPSTSAPPAPMPSAWARVEADLSGCVAALCAAHPLTEDWPTDRLLRAEALGERTLLRKLRTHSPTADERCREMLIALELRAPERVLRALALSPTSAAALAHATSEDTARGGGGADGTATVGVPPLLAYRVCWHPGVRVRSAPSLAAASACCGVRRFGTVLHATRPDATGWVQLRASGREGDEAGADDAEIAGAMPGGKSGCVGYVLSHADGVPLLLALGAPAGGLALPAEAPPGAGVVEAEVDATEVEVTEAEATEEADVEGGSITECTARACTGAGASRQDLVGCMARCWRLTGSTPDEAAASPWLVQAANMGVGGSYVIPPSRFAEDAIRYFQQARLRGSA